MTLSVTLLSQPPTTVSSLAHSFTYTYVLFNVLQLFVYFIIYKDNKKYIGIDAMIDTIKRIIVKLRS